MRKPSWALPTALMLPLLAAGQSPQQQTPSNSGSAAMPVTQVAPPPGIQTPWDINKMLQELNAQNQKLKPLLDQMHPDQWIQNGAPSAYASQYLQARDRLADVIRAVSVLSRQNDSLSLAIDAYFRIEQLEINARSVNECVAKYGDRQTADALQALIAQSFTNRQKFREYIRDLSVQREQDFKIADDEAQRCRGIISKEPPPPPAGRKARK